MRSIVLVSILLLTVMAGVFSTVGRWGRSDHPPVPADPPAPDRREVFFDHYVTSIPLPLDTPTVLGRGDLVTTDTGAEKWGWDISVTRTATHLHVVHTSDIGTFRRLERSLPLTDLPLRLPDDLSKQVVGHFAFMPLSSDVTGQSSIVSFVPDQRHHIPYGERTTIEVAGLTPAGPTGALCWYTHMRRTATHVIITAGSGFDAVYRVTDYTVPLTDLPIDLPTEEIPVTVRGRLYATSVR
jgi:hypothetical protein